MSLADVPVLAVPQRVVLQAMLQALRTSRQAPHDHKTKKGLCRGYSTALKPQRYSATVILSISDFGSVLQAHPPDRISYSSPPVTLFDDGDDKSRREPPRGERAVTI